MADECSWIALFSILRLFRYGCQGQRPFLLLDSCIDYHLQSHHPRRGVFRFRRTCTPPTYYCHLCCSLSHYLYAHKWSSWSGSAVGCHCSSNRV